MERSMKAVRTAGLAVALTGSLFATSANASVIELALAIDGSGSISGSDFALQRDAYGNVFSDSSFYNDFIAPSPYDSLYVSAYQFSTNVVQEIGWTMISDQTDATNFGSLFTFNQLGGSTNTEQGIEDATNGLLNNGVDGDKSVIDVSTDGQPNLCSPSCSFSQADDEAVSRANEARDEGITVNALGVGNGIGSAFLNELVGLNPADSPQGFFLQADSFGEFESTLKTKFGREITEVPEPGSLVLLGMGLLGLGVARRRRLV